MPSATSRNTTRGDAARAPLSADDLSAKAGDQISYEDLYRRWEQGNWSAYEIDFSADGDGWRALSELQRSSALWIYSMFFYGEDAVTDGLSAYIDAAPTEEQKYFLATQQVDEARHAVFFHRFFKEVIGAGGTLSASLAFTEPQLDWGYRGVFARLETMGEELRRDRSLPKFAQAITLYHMIIEASMAQPGQHYIEDFFTKAGTMPGFSEGMHNVARDEQRHIGFGVKVLSELLAESDECRAAVTEILREMLPYLVSVFVPPDWDERYMTAYGFTMEDIYAFGMRSIEAKWRAIGYPFHEMPPSIYPFDPAMPHAERAERQIRLLKAGVLGEPNGRPDSSPEVQEIYFDVVARSADTQAVDQPLTVQWKFSDADPWHVRIDNGSTRAVPGVAEDADVTLRTSWSDWIEISMRGADFRGAVLRRRLRPSGSLRQLRRMQAIWEPRPPVS
ncbi:MAG: ribonucleotide-diphosphate reductase subunit beta [Actinomycetota bacterium]|nr:ribonucleotide-diphosphate reductase subunit beta [Actinomycetota bacterium]